MNNAQPTASMVINALSEAELAALKQAYPDAAFDDAVVNALVTAERVGARIVAAKGSRWLELTVTINIPTAALAGLDGTPQGILGGIHAAKWFTDQILARPVLQFFLRARALAKGVVDVPEDAN